MIEADATQVIEVNVSECASTQQMEIPANVLIHLESAELILGIFCTPGETYTFGENSYLCLGWL